MALKAKNWYLVFVTVIFFGCGFIQRNEVNWCIACYCRWNLNIIVNNRWFKWIFFCWNGMKGIGKFIFSANKVNENSFYTGRVGILPFEAFWKFFWNDLWLTIWEVTTPSKCYSDMHASKDSKNHRLDDQTWFEKKVLVFKHQFHFVEFQYFILKNKNTDA